MAARQRRPLCSRTALPVRRSRRRCIEGRRPAAACNGHAGGGRPVAHLQDKTLPAVAVCNLGACNRRQDFVEQTTGEQLFKSARLHNRVDASVAERAVGGLGYRV
jgi:hypothetical protein